MTIAPWRTAATSPTTDPIRPADRRPGLSGDHLLEVARELSRSLEPWPGADAPTERCWRIVEVTDRFEAWEVAWPVGGAIEFHDHGDSSGAVVVTSGRLVETSLRVGSDGRPVASTAQLPTDGHVVFGSGHVHDIVNDGPGPARSIHVYSPALESMTFFDRRDGHGLVPVRTEHYRDGVLVP
jgi:hypothetical protein